MTDRGKAEKRGHRGEAWAAWWLRLKGHRVLGRRIKTHAGEIDLITLSPFGPVCFVEVKVRANARDAADAVGREQRARIARAASLYLASRPALAKRGARFDIVTVAGLPRHLPDAWRMDG
ncbi:MAG TPA: YraN family protein [Rhizomicrobium sp.]|nr:YraN family protein [Rhizomicrobium sp.]